MIINKKFDYQPLERIDGSNGRRYIVGENQTLPSVTTILAKTKDLTFLKEWANKIGEVEAERIKTEASTLGSGMHKNLENYILGQSMSGSFMAQTLAKVIIKNGLSKVTEVWGTEVQLYSKDLYAGTIDLIGMINNNRPAIIDFKNSLKLKKVEWIDDYRAQIGAYSLSHDEMFGTKLDQGIIMIATRDAQYQEFIFEGEEFKKCIDLWLRRLEKYYQLPEEQQ